MNKERILKEIHNQELLKELAQRIVVKKLKLDTPQELISRYEARNNSPEEIIKNLKEKMGFFNKDGLALTNICEIYDEKTNPHPLNLNYFIVKVKEELKKLQE